jgi:hypothetical protein
MKWMEGAKTGIIVAGGHDEENDLIHLSGSQRAIISYLDTVYVADSYND